MKLQYLGHSAFFLETKEMKALIDPFITGNPLCPILLDEVGELTHLFVTHGHGDHLGDTAELAQRTGATVFCNFEIAHYLQRLGVSQIHPLHLGGSFQNIRMTPALHGSSIQEGDDFIEGGNPGGFLIEAEGVRLYHAGDTGLSMEMHLLKGLVDVALLPVGGNFTMNWEDAQKALAMIEPSIFIPMHYDTFDVIKLEREKIEHRAACELRFLEPGEWMSF